MVFFFFFWKQSRHDARTCLRQRGIRRLDDDYRACVCRLFILIKSERSPAARVRVPPSSPADTPCTSHSLCHAPRPRCTFARDTPSPAGSFSLPLFLPWTLSPSGSHRRQYGTRTRARTHTVRTYTHAHARARAHSSPSPPLRRRCTDETRHDAPVHRASLRTEIWRMKKHSTRSRRPASVRSFCAEWNPFYAVPSDRLNSRRFGTVSPERVGYGRLDFKIRPDSDGRGRNESHVHTYSNVESGAHKAVRGKGNEFCKKKCFNSTACYRWKSRTACRQGRI